MQTGDDFEDLMQYLATSQGLQRHSAERLVAEILAYFGEERDDFVRRRHRELQGAGMANPAIFARIGDEVAARRFPVPAMSERQIRRIIYG